MLDYERYIQDTMNLWHTLLSWPSNSCTGLGQLVRITGLECWLEGAMFMHSCVMFAKFLINTLMAGL